MLRVKASQYLTRAEDVRELARAASNASGKRPRSSPAAKGDGPTKRCGFCGVSAWLAAECRRVLSAGFGAVLQYGRAPLKSPFSRNCPQVKGTTEGRKQTSTLRN